MKTLTFTFAFLALACSLAWAQPTATTRTDEKNVPSDRRDLLSGIRSRANSVSSEVVHIADAQGWAAKPELAIELPGGGSIVLQRADLTHASAGHFSWKAVPPVPGAAVKFDVFGDDVHGVVQTPGFHYVVEPLGDGLHAITQIDPARSSPARAHPVEPSPPIMLDTPKSETVAEINSTPEIGVMVVYTAAARSAQGGTVAMNNLISSAIGLLDDSFGNSLIDVSASLVHTAEIAYTESGNLGTDLGRIRTDGDSYMDGIHDLRNEHGADLVVLVVSSGSGCVDAYQNANSAYGFSVVHYNCIVSDWGLARGIGHNIGAYHDRATGTNPDYQYGHGYTYTAGGWRTIMSQGAGTHLNYWSNPGKSLGGIPMGTSTYEDNARVWEERAAAVAAFKSVWGPKPVVSISGELNMFESGTEMFTANVSGAAGPFSYQWYYRHENDIYWTATGSNSQYYYHTAGPPDGEYIRVVVYDANWPAQEDNKFIIILGWGKKVVSSDEDALPVEFAIKQNFPNPFNPSTNISYSLPEPAQVSIEIYDVMGRLVRSVENGFKIAGHLTTFNASNLTSGVYIARFQAVASSGIVVTKDMKMQLVK